MRLRRLGTTQSVVFYIPPEVQQSVLDVRKKLGKRIGTLNNVDMVTWLLEQTCAGVEQLAPLYVSQGTDYCRREIAARDNDDATHDSAQRAAYLSVLEQPEQYSLAQMYAPKKTAKSTAIDAGKHKDVDGYVKMLQQIKAGLHNTADTVQALAHSEVEQEREVAIEVEVIQERQKPLHGKQALHHEAALY
jgi:cation transport regulator ChaC